MIKIDFENHFYDQSLLEEFSKRQQPPFYRKKNNVITWTDAITMPQDAILPQLLEVAEKRNQLMKEQGVDLVILSSSPGPEQLDEESSIKICRKTNYALAEITKKGRCTVSFCWIQRKFRTFHA
ncbi:hypothetical protein M3226_22370 [Neobacillus cucumis]|uniref:hypothetical protein n=1 Tax=Neobacillus cucumis TaxID=1740721 RepID=UPI002040F125|nr:hypothetical protein [Neobacillus cucumis]MCM3728396.1 hypothetical protein [Neobacillus cucumis]